MSKRTVGTPTSEVRFKAMQDPRLEEILAKMEELLVESRRLKERHDELAEEYSELKREFDELAHKTRPATQF